MSSPRISTRQGLINAAVELFTAQGVTETTTRQIAELAGVNEVTLFRQFGNKHGLLLAVIQESQVLSQLGKLLSQQTPQTSNIKQVLKDYAKQRLQELEQIPEFVRSVVGEAGHYPAENRQALGKILAQGNQQLAAYLAAALDQEQLQPHLPAYKIAGLLNSLLLGYAVIEFTSEGHQLWDHQDDFLESLVELFLQGVVAQPQHLEAAQEIAELPPNVVYSILRQAKKLGLRDYSLGYVLFAAGLSPAEIATLQRSNQICDARQHLLQVVRGTIRQIPVNCRILGKRYGSHTRNPLTHWLKSRKDNEAALFLNDNGKPISEEEIRSRWQLWTAEVLTPEGQLPVIEQAQQTWAVDLLTKGISLADLEILTGWDVTKLQLYARRLKEKSVLAQVIQLDQN